MINTKRMAFIACCCLSLTTGIAAAAEKEVSTKAVSESNTKKTVEPAAPLSVAPLDHVQYPEDRPDWITELDDSADSETMIIQSGICATQEEAQEMLDLMAGAAVQDAVEQLMEQSDNAPIDHDVEIDQRWIDQNLISDRYVGPVHRGGEIAYEGAFKLRLDSEAKEGLRLHIDNHQTGERLAVVGLLALLGFGSFISGSIVLGGWNARRTHQRNV